MPFINSKRSIFFVLLAAGLSTAVFQYAFADQNSESSSAAVEGKTAIDEINQLNGQIKERQSGIDSLNSKIKEYKNQIEIKQQEKASLLTEIELLTNRVAKTKLDIEATRDEIDNVNAETAILDAEIADYGRQLDHDRTLMADIVRKMDVYDNDLPLELLFGDHSFSDLFGRLEELDSVNSDLHTTLAHAKLAQQSVVSAKTEKEAKKNRLEELAAELTKKIDLLDEESSAKETLLAQTQASESQFASLLYDVRQEEQGINNEIASLQGKIDSKISADDGSALEGGVFSWPVDPNYRGISTTFHDPSYPFRHLFEHPGIDIPQPAGTSVKSAGPGYVAWTRVGRLYGNYVMIVHKNGLATLYAHLSKVLVKEDQYVARGDVIALSGGVPGMPGAGLSTGAHLHFEVRKDGVPTDPMPYLVKK